MKSKHNKIGDEAWNRSLLEARDFEKFLAEYKGNMDDFQEEWDRHSGQADRRTDGWYKPKFVGYRSTKGDEQKQEGEALTSEGKEIMDRFWRVQVSGINSPAARARTMATLKATQAVRMAKQRHSSMPPGSSINELTAGDMFEFRDWKHSRGNESNGNESTKFFFSGKREEEWGGSKKVLNEGVATPAEAKERMLAGIPSPKLDEGRTDHTIGKYVGIGKDTLRKAETKERQGTRTNLGQLPAESARSGLDPA